MTLYLVSCVSKKVPTPAAARDLYVSPLFKKSRAWVEARLVPGAAWFILSAKHGLVPPDQVLDPYNKTMAELGCAGRRAWAEDVLAQLPMEGVARVVILAGAFYREDLVDLLRRNHPNVQVDVPMAGLMLGESLRFLNQDKTLDGTAGRAPGGGHPACRCPDGDGALHLAGCPGANDA